MKTTNIMTSMLVATSLAWPGVAWAGDIQPVATTCLDTEEVIIVDEADISVDTRAESRQRASKARERRHKRERQRAKRRERELQRQVEAQEVARQEAETRAKEAEAKAAAQTKARQEDEQRREAEARETVRQMARMQGAAAAAAGDPATAGVRLQIAASTHGDPILWIEAAEYFTDAFDLGDEPAGDQAVSAAMEAKKVGAGLEPAQGDDVRTRADAVLEHVPRLRRQRDEMRRIARAELIAGGSLLAVGAAGFAMVGAGSYLDKAAQRERDRVEGLEGVDTAPLAAQESQAKGLLIAGGVIGSAGVILGGTLLGLGLRDQLRLGRPSGLDRRRRPKTHAKGKRRRLRANLGPGPTGLGATLTLRM